MLSRICTNMNRRSAHTRMRHACRSCFTAMRAPRRSTTLPRHLCIPINIYNELYISGHIHKRLHPSIVTFCRRMARAWHSGPCDGSGRTRRTSRVRARASVRASAVRWPRGTCSSSTAAARSVLLQVFVYLLLMTGEAMLCCLITGTHKSGMGLAVARRRNGLAQPAGLLYS